MLPADMANSYHTAGERTSVLNAEPEVLTTKSADHYIIVPFIRSAGDRYRNRSVGSSMNCEITSRDEFRRLVNRCARQYPSQWEASRRLIGEQEFPSTVTRLFQRFQETDLPVSVKESLRCLLERRDARRVQDLDGELLRVLTGFPPAKAVRALCVYFELIDRPGAQWSVSLTASEEIEERIRHSTNPFDLLLHIEAASVLDLGSGDLSFAEELAELYVPELHRQHRRLTLHCLDRLDPRSKLGGPLHPSQERLRKLRDMVGPTFSYFGNQDMFALDRLDAVGQLASRYAIVTCWAPATPTFAYEPSRLSQSIIAEELYKTKGPSRQIWFQGEPALEVRHGDRALLFPPWKFEIIGPIALLKLLAKRGILCILGAVDNQVFWEILAQLLEEPRYRPIDLPFTADNLPEVFGGVYEALKRLPVGHSINLEDLGALRCPVRSGASTASPSVSEESIGGFRYVRISRGATFPGIPASSTARLFPVMVEEAAPWFLTLVPA